MNQRTINFIFIIAFAYPAFKFIYRYVIQQLLSIVKNKSFAWDKDIDKPRLWFYFGFTLLAGIMWYILIFQIIPNTGKSSDKQTGGSFRPNAFGIYPKGCAPATYKL